MKSIPLEGRIWLLSLSSLPDRIQSLYVLSLRTPTLHFFSKLTCKNFLFRRFRDTALFFFPFLSGLKKPCVRTFPDARLLIFFSMFLCLFLMFSLVLRMDRIFWFLQRRLSKKCQRGVPKNNICHCATPFDTFFVNPFDTLLSFQNRSQNRTATCTTHTPHPTMKISRLQNHLPELLFSLFFLLIFVLLSGTFATFFAIFIFLFKSLNRLFSRLSVYFKASYCWFFFFFF